MERINVNGWNTIARYLQQSEFRQNDLAKLLNVSAAAISQIKSGKYLLSPLQMKQIIQFLHFDEKGVSDFYTELFNARIVCSDVVDPEDGSGGAHLNGNCLEKISPIRRRINRVPLTNLSDVVSYEPALETLDEFIARNFPSRLAETRQEPGLCALRVLSHEPKLSLRSGSILLVGARAYPQPGDLCLLCLTDGELLLKEFFPEGGKIIFRRPFDSGGRDFCWQMREDPHRVSWIHPIREIILKLN